jgi:hypothetical protein
VLLLLLQCALSWAFSLGGQAGGFRHQTSLCIRSRWQNYRSSTSKTVLMAKKTQPAPLPTTDDPFLLLGLDNATADKQEIKRAYRKRAMQYHPDVLLDPDSTEAEREQASKNFARINAAYEMLTGGTKGNANTGSTSAKTTSGGYNYQPPHRRSSSYSSSSSTRSTNWEDYMPNYNDEDAKYDAGGDSFSSIFSDLLTGAVGAAAGVAGSRGGGIFGDFIDFLEGNIDGFESGYSGYDDDRSLSELLNSGSFDDIANEMDETDILVTSLETKQKSVENDLVQIQADLNVATKFSEKLDLEERIAELKAREKVVKGYLKKGRNRLVRLRERYKELMVEGRGGRGYGSRTSESSASSSSYSASSSGPSSSYRTTNPSTTSSPPPSPPPPAPSTSASSDKNWRTEGFSSSYGRSSSGRRSSRGNRRRTESVDEPSESSATNQQQPNQQQQRASETYSNRSSSSTNSSARSSTSSPLKQYEPWVPPHRRTTSSTEAAAQDKKRLRELQVDDEFEKLKREMGM